MAIAFVAVCTALGVWQLRRRSERLAWNNILEARLAAHTVPATTLPADTASGHYRRVVARGTFDFELEVVLATRTSQGSPGVHLLTPLRLGDGALAIVNRGWVYSPDAMTIDPTRWREHEGDTVEVTGYAETWSSREVAPAAATRRVVRAPDSAAVARLLGEPVPPYYLVQTSDSAPRPNRPVRLQSPVLDEGPHRGYAIQWFSFALIAAAGAALIVHEELVRRRATS